MGSLFKSPVPLNDIGSVIGFVVLVAASMALVNRIGPVRKLVG